MATIIVPTQAQLQQSQQDPNSLLAVWNAANTPKPAAGTPGAVTEAAGTANPQLNALNNTDWIKSMSEMISQINIDAQQKANAARIPNATGLETQSSANIASALGGNVPNDVYRQMAQRSAERGVSTGSPMGANSTADIMRALGLTSLDLQNTGQTWLNQALGRNPGATPANTQALVTTPAQAEALALQKQNMELDYLAQMAAINARRASGYGGGGGSPSGSFRPTTNWQGGAAPTQTATSTPIVSGWSDPNNPANPGWISDADWNDLLYGYPGEDLTPPPATNPQGGWGSYDLNPVTYNPNLYPGAGIDQSGMSQEELDWLYNVGG